MSIYTSRPMRLAVFLFLPTILILGTSLAAQELTPEAIESRLDRVDTETRIEMEAMRCILSSDQFRALMSEPGEIAWRSWIDSYWQDRDPDFATEENENRIEHERRVEHVRLYFFLSEWPGWDSRGEVYIRYGRPTVQATTPADVTAMGPSPARELWYYRDHDMFIRFEDPFGRNDFSYFQEHIVDFRESQRLRVESELGTQYMTEEVGQFDVPEVLPPEIAAIASYERFMEKLRHFYDVLESTPSTYTWDFDTRRMPFVFTVDNFRGGSGVNRVDVNLEFMAERAPIGEKAGTREYVATAVFRDFHGAVVERHESKASVPTAGKGADAKLVPTQLKFTVPAGFYSVAVSMRERTENRLTSYRTDLTTPDFDEDLIVSDIVVAADIAEAATPSPFNRGALRVVPHPARTYRRSAVIPVYFEVYNLGENEGGMSEYKIEYEVVGDEPKPRGFFGSIFRGDSFVGAASEFDASGYGTFDIVRLRIGTENLWAGEFTLRVNIEDRVSGAETTQEVGFRLLE